MSADEPCQSHARSPAWTADADRCAVDQYSATIGLVEPIKYIHQCRFAGAVFPEQRVDFAGTDINRTLSLAMMFPNPW